MVNGDSQWYSNKELYEKLTDISGDFIKLSGEMKETRVLIKQYNGLREEIEEVKRESFATQTKVNTMADRWHGRNKTLDTLRNWGGWVFGLITLIILIYNQII